MKIKYIKEGYFNNPEQAKKVIANKANMSSADKLAKSALTSLISKYREQIITIVGNVFLSSDMFTGTNLTPRNFTPAEAMSRNIYKRSPMYNDYDSITLDKLEINERDLELFEKRVGIRIEGEIIIVPVYPFTNAIFTSSTMLNFSNDNIYWKVTHVERILRRCFNISNLTIKLEFSPFTNEPGYRKDDRGTFSIAGLKIYHGVKKIDKLIEFFKERTLGLDKCLDSSLELILINRWEDKNLKEVGKIGEIFKFNYIALICFSSNRDRVQDVKLESLDGIENLLENPNDSLDGHFAMNEDFWYFCPVDNKIKLARNYPKIERRIYPNDEILNLYI